MNKLKVILRIATILINGFLNKTSYSLHRSHIKVARKMKECKTVRFLFCVSRKVDWFADEH